MLFMSPNLYDDVSANKEKTVVIYLTAGDDGKAYGDDTSSYPHARELASVEATDWMADVNAESPRDTRKTETVTIHEHTVSRVIYANTVSYLLHLPDGRMDGTGTERYGFQSLKKLKAGKAALAPVNGSEAYADWQDLLVVLAGILDRELPDAKHINVHLAEPDDALNHPDHSDHTTAANAVLEVINQHGKDTCYTIYKHIGYGISQRPENLEGKALQNKAGGFAVLTATQRRYLGFHHWDKDHQPYLTRNYFTEMNLPEGCQ